MEARHSADPLDLFTTWWSHYREVSTKNLHGACVLSTIGLDNIPNARTVSLKKIIQSQYVFTSSIDSQKGKELIANPAAALTFWWEDTNRQIRMQGHVKIASQALADQLFGERSVEARLISDISNQSEPLDDYDQLLQQLNNSKSTSKAPSRPKEWLAFGFEPHRYEFMEFHQSRLHHRTVYVKEGDNWNSYLLQP